MITPAGPPHATTAEWIPQMRSDTARSDSRNLIARTVLEVLTAVSAARREGTAERSEHLRSVLAQAERADRGPDRDGWADQLNWAAGEARQLLR